jgi:glutamate dehydrogenase/leucine dehydrogenase
MMAAASHGFPHRPCHQKQGIMESIYNASAAAAKKYGTSFVNGANIAGFVQVADAMLAQGCV